MSLANKAKPKAPRGAGGAALTIAVWPVPAGKTSSFKMLREMDAEQRLLVLTNLRAAVDLVEKDLAAMAANGGRMPFGESAS